jgi:transposase
VINVRKLNRVKILMLADESHANGHKTDQEIAEKLDISPATVERTRRAYVEEGLKEALNEKPRSGRPPVISGETRAQITALACSTPPEGFGQWSLRLLADKAVELQFIETISHESVGTILKKRCQTALNSRVVFRQVDRHLSLSNGANPGHLCTAL